MSRRFVLRAAALALGTAAALAGCVGIPAPGTPERAAWIADKQALAEAIEYNGRYGDSLRHFPLPRGD